MKTKSFKEIIERLKDVRFYHTFDLVVGIARGGIVPAYLVSNYLQLPLELIWINFRNHKHQPQHSTPKLLKPIQFDPKEKKILLVDDRANSGQTIQLVRSLLKTATLIESLLTSA